MEKEGEDSSLARRDSFSYTFLGADARHCPGLDDTTTNKDKQVAALMQLVDQREKQIPQYCRINIKLPLW